MKNAASASASGAAAAKAAFPVQGYLGGMRVLVVEEDPAYLTTLTQKLQRYGYQVTAKASPEEGLRALQENPKWFDLVMTVVRTQGPGIDGFELLKHAAEAYPVVLFSGIEPTATMMRGTLGGACAVLTKPLRDEDLRDVWQYVVRRSLSAGKASGAASGAAAVPDAPRRDAVVVRQDDTAARKRGAARLDDSGEGGSDGSRQRRKQRVRTTKKTKFDSSAESDLHAAVVKAAEQLRGTEEYCTRGIHDLLKDQGVKVTIDQVTRHMEKYRSDCLTNDLSAMAMASSSHYDISKNYSTPGSSGFYMRPQGATNINQTNLLSNNGASPLGNESYRSSHVGHLYNNGNHHGNANGNCIVKYGNGYDYQHGNGNFNDNANASGCQNANASMVNASLPSNLAQQVHQAMPEGYGNFNDNANASGYQNANASMVNASLPSNLAQQVHQAMPEGYGNFSDNANANGCQNANGSMVNASLPSNLEQQVRQAVPEGYGNFNENANANGSMVNASLLSNLAQQVHEAMPEGYGNFNENANASGCENENGSMVNASLLSNLAQQVHEAMPEGYGNFNENANASGCENANGSMVNASLPSNLAQQVHEALPEGYGNGRGGLSASENMVPSNLAQPVQQAMPTNMDNPNPIVQQEFPRVSQLWYDGSTGGISMMPWPVDDDEELLRSYLQGDNEVMGIQNTAPADMTEEGVHGDGAAGQGQISASQPQNLTDPLSSGSSNGNGTAGTSGKSGAVTDGISDGAFCDELDEWLKGIH